MNPLFIQKKDLNSDRLQLSFTVHRFSKAYLQRRRGPPLLQNTSSAEKGTTPSLKHIFSREGNTGGRANGHGKFRHPHQDTPTRVRRRYSLETAAQKRGLHPFKPEHTSFLSSLHRPEFYLYSLLQFNRVKIGCLNLAYAI